MQLEPLHPIQIQRFREMTFAEKWAVAQGLWLMARDARLAASRRANPDLTEEEHQKLVAREFARTRTESPCSLRAAPTRRWPPLHYCWIGRFHAL